MTISLIVAMTRDRVIGAENRLPWRLPEDLKHFRKLTTGHTVIMGRKTFESIGRPLPNRRNIVISRQGDYRADGVEVVSSLDEALARAREADPRGSSATSSRQVFVIGGAEIYRLALPRADRLHVTWIEREFAGDARFPEWETGAFREVACEDHLEAEIPHRFVELARAVYGQ